MARAFLSFRQSALYCVRSRGPNGSDQSGLPVRLLTQSDIDPSPIAARHALMGGAQFPILEAFFDWRTGGTTVGSGAGG